jgi:hypothetical protein
MGQPGQYATTAMVILYCRCITAWPVSHTTTKKGCLMQKNDPFLVLAVIDRHQRYIFSVSCHYVANSKDASLLP